MALFEGIYQIPSDEVIKIKQEKDRKLDELRKKKVEDFISKGMKARLRAKYKEDGLNEKEIDKLIRKEAERLRSINIKSIEEKYG